MDFGATGQGHEDDTQAIDKAIEKCNEDGGGSVVFPAGTYLAASIHIKSNVQLLLDKEAVIKGAATGFDPPEKSEYEKYQDFGHSHYHDALMWGEDIENFAIIGGTIDGGSISRGGLKPGGGDKQIAIKTGKNLLFKDITQKIGGHFVYLLNNCVDVTISNIVIQGSRDAIDLMSCSDVQISGCNFTGCVDDTIGVKSDYNQESKHLCLGFLF
jgi:polygalacturonase